MRSKKWKYIVTLLAVLLLGVMTVEAGLSFIGSVQVAGGSVHATGSIAGFGNGDVNVTLNVKGSGLEATCYNKGGKDAPGQNPVNIDQSTTIGLDKKDADSNGRYNFNLDTDLVPTAEQACPNGNWKLLNLKGHLVVTITAAYTDGSGAVSQIFDCDIDELAGTFTCTQR